MYKRQGYSQQAPGGYPGPSSPSPDQPLFPTQSAPASTGDASGYGQPASPSEATGLGYPGEDGPAPDATSRQGGEATPSESGTQNGSSQTPGRASE